MEVLKFGGSSLVTAAAMQRVADVLVARRGVQRIVVCSAMGGVTNELLALGRLAVARDAALGARVDALAARHTDALEELGASAAAAEVGERVGELRRLLDGVSILGELSPRSSDALVSFGERLAVPLVAALLTRAGLNVHRVDARDWIATDDAFGAAEVDRDRTVAAIRTGVAADSGFEILLTEGFIGRSPQGETTTLGRGGSDYTASLIARAVGADCMEKSTDVAGMMTADPRLVREAQIIDTMSYEEALELCHFGAKVIYHPTIEPLRQAGIPLIVRSTFDSDAPGTRIVAAPERPAVVRALSSIDDVVLLTLVGGRLLSRPGFSRRVFTALATASVNVVLITQSSSEHSLTIGISAADRAGAEAALHEEFDADMELGRLEPLQVETGLSIIALVGGGMKAASGVSGKAFAALGASGVNIRAIAQGSTERNISIVVASADVARGLRAVHRAFFDNGVRRLNLVCLGTGQVGAALLDQIHRTAPPGLDLRVIGLANSRQALLNPAGIDLADWRTALAAAPVPPAHWCDAVAALDLPNVVFVDNTASPEAAATVLEAVRRGYAAACSNKIAATGPLADWRDLTAGTFYHESNVGAGLPVLDTLKQLIATGDRIHRIEAVMSGSLNFIFNRFSPSCTFESAVREAAAAGYTEPDPRLDLGGVDVARKVLILARLAGAPLELADVAITPFLPATAFEGSVDDFYAALPACEAELSARLAQAGTDHVLRVVGSWSPEGGAEVALRMLPLDHPLARLAGTDNKFTFLTDRYPEQPLVIQGAGAGAEVTAMGVFSDLLRIGK